MAVRFLDLCWKVPFCPRPSVSSRTGGVVSRRSTDLPSCDSRLQAVLSDSQQSLSSTAAAESGVKGEGGRAGGRRGGRKGVHAAAAGGGAGCGRRRRLDVPWTRPIHCTANTFIRIPRSHRNVCNSVFVPQDRLGFGRTVDEDDTLHGALRQNLRGRADQITRAGPPPPPRHAELPLPGPFPSRIHPWTRGGSAIPGLESAQGWSAARALRPSLPWRIRLTNGGARGDTLRLAPSEPDGSGYRAGGRAAVDRRLAVPPAGARRSHYIYIYLARPIIYIYTPHYIYIPIIYIYARRSTALPEPPSSDERGPGALAAWAFLCLVHPRGRARRKSERARRRHAGTRYLPCFGSIGVQAHCVTQALRLWAAAAAVRHGRGAVPAARAFYYRCHTFPHDGWYSHLADLKQTLTWSATVSMAATCNQLRPLRYAGAWSGGSGRRRRCSESSRLCRIAHSGTMADAESWLHMPVARTIRSSP